MQNNIQEETMRCIIVVEFPRALTDQHAGALLVQYGYDYLKRQEHKAIAPQDITILPVLQGFAQAMNLEGIEQELSGCAITMLRSLPKDIETDHCLYASMRHIEETIDGTTHVFSSFCMVFVNTSSMLRRYVFPPANDPEAVETLRRVARKRSAAQGELVATAEELAIANSLADACMDIIRLVSEHLSATRM